MRNDVVYTVGARAVRQLLPALHQLSQGQDADGPRHRGDRLAAAGPGRHRGDAGVPARPAAAQPSVVAAGQQRPRAGTLRRPGRTHGICVRPPSLCPPCSAASVALGLSVHSEPINLTLILTLSQT